MPGTVNPCCKPVDPCCCIPTTNVVAGGVGGGYGRYSYILVLFILLVICGAAFWF